MTYLSGDLPRGVRPKNNNVSVNIYSVRTPMFSKRTPLFLRPNLDYRMLKLLSLFAALILTLLYTSSTTSSIIHPELAEAEAASSIAVYSPSTYSYPSLAYVDEKLEILRVMLESDVVESAIAPEILSSNDSDSNADYPDSDLTDSSSTPPRLSRVTVAFIVLAPLLTIHPPSDHPFPYPSN
ncbi:hypothetical protein F5050DRAFT_426897 [Lentinula boryana]|uniref:Uncharacterized protein n=1 Tax=Lentinula boryana TaxID=40481 RepID=A0ABQ8Q8E9_9AGAR|nr:hypothetical protein F5050DRAFT_426897 [Lentinula boryana]